MVEKNNITSTIKVLFLLLAALFGAIIISFMFIGMGSVSEDQQDPSIVSDSINQTYESPITLTAGNGITTSEVNANNLTWLEFDGVDDYVETQDSQLLNLTKNWTISVWFNHTNQSEEEQIFSKGNATVGSRGYQAKIPHTSNKVVLELEDVWLSWSGRDIVSENIWHNLAITYDGINAYWSLDGNAQSIIPSTNNLISPDLPLTIGKINNGTRYWNGSIDDFIIYNRSMFAGEMTGIYFNDNRRTNKIIPTLYMHNLAGNGINAQNETTFNNIMGWLNDSGFETITDIEYYNWTVGGGFIMPEKPFIITFDDEQQTVVNASIIMSNYGYKGVLGVVPLFVNCTPVTCAGYGGGLDYMNWTEINTLVTDYNWSLTGHGNTHCNMITACNTTQNWTDEFSNAKTNIIGNTSFTPITWIYPFNSWNSTVMTYCENNYTMCYGSSLDDGKNLRYNTNGTGLVDGGLWRLSIENLVTTSDIARIMNYTYNENLKRITDYGFNANNGTAAYDTSGNSNDGTISGATWTTDGILITLAAITDYTINPTTGLFTIVNNDYLFSWIKIDWDYDDGDALGSIRQVSENSLNAIVVYTAGGETQLSTVSITIVLLLLIGLFVVFWKSFIGGEKKSSIAGGNFG